MNGESDDESDEKSGAEADEWDMELTKEEESGDEESDDHE